MTAATPRPSAPGPSTSAPSAPATSALPFIDADTIMSTLPWVDAVGALDRALTGGLDPDAGLARNIVDVTHGQVLLMPGETPEAVGVKVATVAPDNPGRGLPRIHGVYLLLDRETLVPVALLDGIALTTLRTPAVSAVAVDHLAVPDASRLVVFGTGPQGRGHVESVRAVRPIESVTVIGRDSGRLDDMVAYVRDLGLSASAGTPDAVADADIVVCATTAGEPLFDGALLPDHACAVAVGSHDADARELDETVLRRAAETGRVVVESRASALTECGDVVMAIDRGAIGRDDLTDLGQATRLDPPGGVSVFKSAGMGWEDLVVAQAVLDRWQAAGDL